jgi:HEAT repeat protein
MRQLRHLRNIFTGTPAVLTALGALVLAAPALTGAEPSEPFRADPVAELEQFLKNDKNPGKTLASAKFREETLAKLEKKLITVSDLGRALLLKDLTDNAPESSTVIDLSDSDKKVRRDDLAFRKRLAGTFQAAVRKIFAEAKDERGAAAALIGELAASSRVNNIRSPIVQQTLVGLVPDLVRLARSDAGVLLRAIAIRSLGRLQGEVTDKEGAPVKDRYAADESVPSLRALLQSTQTPLEVRRAAAEALGEMVRDLPANYKKARPPTAIGPPMSPADYLRICRLVFGAAGQGLSDPDAKVRELGVEAIRPAAVAVSDYIPLPARREDYPAEGRTDLTPEEQAEIDRLRARVTEERREIQPVLEAFRDQARPLARILKSPESSADLRFAAVRALEEMGYARIRLLNREASVPVYKKKPDKQEEEAKPPPGKVMRDPPIVLVAARQPQVELTPDPLLEGLKIALPALASRSVDDQDPRVRTRAIETMDSMGDEAASAWEFLRFALRPGENRFVQWAAARALGRMNPDKAHAKEVVPYLAALLRDPDVDVRLNVARAFESWGFKAGYEVVVAALTRAAGTEEDTSPWPPAFGFTKPPAPGTSDPEVRIAAMKALAAIGTAAAPAVPTLAAALADSEVRVRRAAAETLGRFGAYARKAEPELRRALMDNDLDVRRLASEALLNLQAK